METSTTDVAIIGAGPNGLGLATYLRQSGIEHRIFGSPMRTWRDMPKGMYLKSLGFATSIPTPSGHPTFPEYCRTNGLEDYEPIEFATFAEYGMAFQRELVPNVEDTKVTRLARSAGLFHLTLETGEELVARRVVVAVGLTYFPRVPDVFAELPADRVTHTWGPKDFPAYDGKDVVVIGAGSSALETATLLAEHGARVRLLAHGEVRWGGRVPRDSERSIIERIKLPVTSLGHGRENWVLQHLPWLMHRLPSEKRISFTRRHLGPGPAWWLHQRADGTFAIQDHTAVVDASVSNGRVHLKVQGEEGEVTEIAADHVITGTGYVFDIDKISFIDPDLAQDIARYELAPKLSRHFESSVPGLYFLGPVAAESFGPLVRFVAGAPFAVSRVASKLTRRAGARSASRPRALATRPAVASSNPSA